MKTDFIGEGAYPELTAKNCTGPDTRDGTPVNDALVNDIWGFFQAAAFQGNIIPSENSDTYLASDILNGIANMCGTPGEIVYSGINLNSISVLGARLLYATGQLVLCSQYSRLVDYCYVGDLGNALAKAFYKCDEFGVKSTSGLYLKIPDLRHYFIRGVNTGVPNFNQANDQIKSHKHTVRSPDYGTLGYAHASGKISAASGTSFTAVTLNADSLSGNPVYANFEGEDIDGNAFGEDETRPTHVSIRCYIRY